MDDLTFVAFAEWRVLIGSKKLWCSYQSFAAMASATTMVVKGDGGSREGW